MTTIPIERDLARELVETKLRVLKEEIASLLSKWEYESSQKFIEDVRAGKVSEAEVDAISLTNLLDIKLKFENILSSIGE